MKRCLVMWLMFGAWSGMSGCGVTETGNPPLVMRELLSGDTEVAGLTTVDGAAGSVSPASGTAWLGNLTTGVVETALVSADGSFSVSIEEANLGELIRVHVFDERVSLPVDFVRGAGGLEDPVASCIAVTPSDPVLRGESAMVTLTNTCARALNVEVGALIDVGAGTIEGPLAEGASANLTITLDDGADFGVLAWTENRVAAGGITLER